MNFVKDLLLDGAQIDHATRAFGLGDRERAVRLDLGNRKPDIGKFGDVLEAGIGKISAGHLAAAFEEMAGERSGRQPVPVGPLPSELRDERAEHQRGIGHPPRDDHLRAVPDRFRDLPGADIGIG